MYQWILLAIGVAGFGLAAYWDLKTTEFPDWLPYTMIILALLVRGGASFFLQDWAILTQSVIIGLAFLGFGLLLYFSKQWGDGDGWLLGALGFLFPLPSGFIIQTGSFPFPFTMLFNFFIVAFIYLVIYSIALGIRTPGVKTMFLKSLRKGAKGMVSVIVVFTIACFSLVAYMNLAYLIPLQDLSTLLIFPVVLILLLLFLRYGRLIETQVFRKRIPASRLRPGDVLITQRWRGLTEKEVRALKKKGGRVWIKEGVRFAPVFIITLLVTLSYGSLAMLFLPV